MIAIDDIAEPALKRALSILREKDHLYEVSIPAYQNLCSNDSMQLLKTNPWLWELLAIRAIHQNDEPGCWYDWLRHPIKGWRVSHKEHAQSLRISVSLLRALGAYYDTPVVLTMNLKDDMALLLVQNRAGLETQQYGFIQEVIRIYSPYDVGRTSVFQGWLRTYLTNYPRVQRYMTEQRIPTENDYHLFDILYQFYDEVSHLGLIAALEQCTIIQREMQKEQLADRLCKIKTISRKSFDLKGFPGKVYLSEGYTLFCLVNEPALLIEGAYMLHCVGGYARKCCQGSSVIYSLRQKGYRVATIEIDTQDNSIRQCYGASNQDVPEYIRTMVEKWLKSQK